MQCLIVYIGLHCIGRPNAITNTQISMLSPRISKQLHVQCSYGTEHNTVTSNTRIPVRYNAAVAIQCLNSAIHVVNEYNHFAIIQ